MAGSFARNSLSASIRNISHTSFFKRRLIYVYLIKRLPHLQYGKRRSMHMFSIQFMRIGLPVENTTGNDGMC